MKPRIDKTKFGSITINGGTYDYDIIIRLSGAVKKRKKKLSKAIFGTSHILSLPEAEHVYDEGAQCLIIGTGQTGLVKISDEAGAFFASKGCKVELFPTPDALNSWNEAEGAVIGLFHITC